MPEGSHAAYFVFSGRAYAGAGTPQAAYDNCSYEMADHNGEQLLVAFPVEALQRVRHTDLPHIASRLDEAVGLRIPGIVELGQRDH